MLYHALRAQEAVKRAAQSATIAGCRYNSPTEKGWRFRPIFYAGGMPTPGARETLELMLGHLGLVFEVEESEQGGRTVLNVRTREPARIVGRDGHNLDEVQYLLNRLLDRGEEGALGVIVDVEGHRRQEKLDFIGHIRQIADNVRRTGEPYRLAPMNSYDRRLVHQAFVDDPEITTQSEEGSARLKHITLVPRTPGGEAGLAGA